MQLLEGQVNITTLAEVYNAAYMDVSSLESDGCEVDVDGYTIIVKLMSDAKYIKYLTYCLLKNIDLSQALLIANNLNDQYIFVKFIINVVDGNIYLFTNYYITYKKGIIKHHIIDSIKMFKGITLQAIKEAYVDYL